MQLNVGHRDTNHTNLTHTLINYTPHCRLKHKFKEIKWGFMGSNIFYFAIQVYDLVNENKYQIGKY